MNRSKMQIIEFKPINRLFEDKARKTRGGNMKASLAMLLKTSLEKMSVIGSLAILMKRQEFRANRPVERKLQIYGELPHVLPRDGFTRPVASARRGPARAEHGVLKAQPDLWSGLLSRRVAGRIAVRNVETPGV